ncbi:hypothetical protein BT69DRAFT_1389445 [Atractiella rhizophila]|nr:hypothetical protein BT69DRAFT_1389445 [Atractiella rhizophila]
MIQPFKATKQLVNISQQPFQAVQRLYAFPQRSPINLLSLIPLPIVACGQTQKPSSPSSNTDQLSTHSSSPHTPLRLETKSSYSTNSGRTANEVDEMDTSDDDSLYERSSPAKSEEDVNTVVLGIPERYAVSIAATSLLLRIFRMVIYMDYLDPTTAHQELAKISLVGALDHLQTNRCIGPLIKSLHVESLNLDPAKVIPVLNQCPMLQHFSLARPNHEEYEATEGLHEVVKILAAMKTVVSLDLTTWASSSDDDQLAFSLDIFRPQIGLQHLKVSGCTVIEGHDKASGTLTVPLLRTFVLSHCKLDEAHASDLLDTLRNARELKHCPWSTWTAKSGF